MNDCPPIFKNFLLSIFETPAAAMQGLKLILRRSPDISGVGHQPTAD
jgi:hypothetical protein